MQNSIIKAQAMVPVQSDIDIPANPRRGAEWNARAIAFAQKYPLGSYKQPRTITIEQFDKWLEEVNFLTVPPEGTARDSDAWLGHLQRRHQGLKSLNKASAHPRLRLPENGPTQPYSVSVGGGNVVIRPVHEQISQGEVPKKLATILQTKRRQLRYLMESADWAVLPPHERMLAEALNDDLDLFEYQIRGSVTSLSHKFDKLAHKIEKAVATKQVAPQNGGIKKFLADVTVLEVYEEEEDAA